MQDIKAETALKRKTYVRLLPMGMLAFVFALFGSYWAGFDMSFNAWALPSMTLIITVSWVMSYFDRIHIALVDIVLQGSLGAFFLAKVGWVAWLAPAPGVGGIAEVAPFVLPYFAFVFWINPDRRRAMKFSVLVLALFSLVTAPRIYRWIEFGERSELTYLLVLLVMAVAILLLILQAYGEKERRTERTLAKTSVEARNDPLTRVYNRRGMVAHLEASRNAFQRQAIPFSLILTDLDRFKHVNDMHGHNVGDEVLFAVARILRSGVRELDHVGRWGGEEFVLLLPSARLEQAASLAERLRKDIEEATFPKGIQLTASFGVTEFQDGDEINDLVARADAALYKAKENGRNQVQRYVDENTS